MNTDIIKQVVGIDIAKDELVVTVASLTQDQQVSFLGHKKVSNTHRGMDDLVKWVDKIKYSHLTISYVMEATGSYYERFAYYLADKGLMLSVVLPNKISNYHRTLDIKTITDKTASQTIAAFGLQRKLESWNKPGKVYYQLRQLTRERSQLIEETTIISNQLHAEEAGAYPHPGTIKRMKARLKILQQQKVQIEQEINELLNSDKELLAQVERICTIKGLGRLTVVTVVAETNGFALIRNKKQLVSYAGLDIVEKQSGSSVRGKGKISKKGNRYIRKAMYFPAFTAIRTDPRMKAVYTRIVSRHGIKMKAAVAIQRKLLELLFILWNKKQTYDPNYLQQAEQKIKAVIN